MACRRGGAAARAVGMFYSARGACVLTRCSGTAYHFCYCDSCRLWSISGPLSLCLQNGCGAASLLVTCTVLSSASWSVVVVRTRVVPFLCCLCPDCVRVRHVCSHHQSAAVRMTPLEANVNLVLATRSRLRCSPPRRVNVGEGALRAGTHCTRDELGVRIEAHSTHALAGARRTAARRVDTRKQARQKHAQRLVGRTATAAASARASTRV